MIHPEPLLTALARCREVAESEYVVAAATLDRASKISERVRRKVEELTRATRSRKPREPELEQAVARLEKNLTGDIERLLARSRRALAGKHARLRKFTISLFGRTMAGKSSLREAITGGDGRTIGRGAQNTTLRNREYGWKGLHIIDTPGIGAYDGERYRQQAVSVVGKSDLVLFLLSDDSIREDVFEGMREVFDENKPLIFVLNVKVNLKDELNLERFLADPFKVVRPSRVEGNYRSIRRLAEEKLGMRNVRILPIHAQAAHMAGRTEWEYIGDVLLRSSGMESLHDALRHEVTTSGEIRRLQTLIDGTIGTLEPLLGFYKTEAANLRSQNTYMRRKRRAFEVRASAFARDNHKALQNAVIEVLAPLRSQVFGFVEDCIEKKNIDALWTVRVRDAGIEKGLKSAQDACIARARDLIDDLGREIRAEVDLGGMKDAAGVRHYDKVNLRRHAGRASVLLVGLSAVCASATVVQGIAAAANFWNPAGAVLMIAGAITGILARFLPKKAKMLTKAKEKAREHLNESIDKAEAELKNRLLEWFDREIVAKFIRRTCDNFEELAACLDGTAGALAQAGRETAGEIDKLNRRLLLCAMSIRGAGLHPEWLPHVSRVRGQVFRIVCTRLLRHRRLSRIATEALGEDVRFIPDGPLDAVVRASFRPARIRSIKEDGSRLLLRLGPAEIKKLGSSVDAVFQATRDLTKRKIECNTQAS